MKWKASYTAGCLEANSNTWCIGRGWRMSEDQKRMSKPPDNWYPSSTTETLKHHNTYPPLSSPISLPVLSPISPTPQTQSLQTGPQADTHQDATPLK